MGDFFTVLSAIFGSQFTFESISLIFTFLESQLAISLFCRRFPHRKPYVFRLVFAAAESIVLCYLLAIWNTLAGTLFVRVLCYLLICAINLGFLAFCWRGSAGETMIAFCSGLAAYQIGNKFFPLLQNLCGMNDRGTISLFHGAETATQPWEYLLFYGTRIAIYLLLAILFRPKSDLATDTRTQRSVAALSVITLLIVNVLVCVARVYEVESLAMSIVVKIFTIAFSFIILMLSAGIFQRSEREQQIVVLNQLMKQEKMQFDSVKANMDTINMKCHDLKHIISKLEGKLTSDEADSLREAIRFYDANIDSGNEVLDVVLCEKAMLCEKNGIAFSCMADGRKFTFLSPVQTYSLFGNIIDNAIEALQKLDDPDKKVISLICAEQDNALVVEESNYSSGALVFNNGIPTTGKEDTSRHGFGVRSIRYIAEQYGGVLELNTVDDMFFLKIRFPKQNG